MSLPRGRKLWCGECGEWVYVGHDQADELWARHEARQHRPDLLSEHPDLLALDAELERWFGQ